MSARRAVVVALALALLLSLSVCVYLTTRLYHKDNTNHVIDKAVLTEPTSQTDATPPAGDLVQETREADDEADDGDEADSVEEVVLHDCFPDAGSPQVALSAAACQQRGCDWDENVATGQPWCALSLSHGVRYSLASQHGDQGSNLRMVLTAHGTAPYGADFANPVFTADFLSDTLLRFTFDDDGANPARYRVPLDLNLPSGGAKNPLYEFQITSTENFAFKIIRKATGTVVVDTGVEGLILSDQYLQLATRLPSKNVYGFGENLHNSFRHPMDSHPHLYRAFARDIAPIADDETKVACKPRRNDPKTAVKEGVPLYGVQPFYTCLEDSAGNSYGMLLLNSNAQEYTVTSDPMLTWRTIGGVLDFFLFLGPSPENVVQQYTQESVKRRSAVFHWLQKIQNNVTHLTLQLVGLPVMPPYWGLGFQLSKWGYDNLNTMKRVVSETLRYAIPLDVQYADIDHMDERKDFTVDNNNFAGLNDYWQSLRAEGMRTVIIIDPCLAREMSYEPYQRMRQVRGNIQWPADVQPNPDSIDDDRSVLGNVWPDPKVVFPDFFKNATRTVWKELIVNHRRHLVFDGLWIDMNEPSNFETNNPRPGNWKPIAGLPLQCGNNTWDDPPYRPLATTAFDTVSRKAHMSDKTVCMNSVQGDNDQYLHYNVHSLYAWSQSSVTKEAAEASTGERSMVITRSNFPGSGRYAGHWLGDNHSSWENMRQSIIGMLEYNLFGIPFVGADICGFNDVTTPELCLRWMQLGAFYPFSRNHNTRGPNHQHPGNFGEEFAQASREILETRYWMLPYLYTLFHQVHTQGGTVARPLHHEFPSDSNALGIDKQFLWGPGFLISPILQKGQTTLEFYVPEGRWYDFYQATVYDGPRSVTIPVSYYSKPQLMLRGGYIIPTQRPANNTAFSRLNPLTLKVMLSNHDNTRGSANGSLFWDDGVSVDTFEKGNYYFATFAAHQAELKMEVEHNNGISQIIDNLHFETIEIYGIASIDDINITTKSGQIRNFTYDFSKDNQVLILHVRLPLTEQFTVVWSDVTSGNSTVFPPAAAQVPIDCFPDAFSPQAGFSQDACERRHCAFDNSVPQGQPWCFLPPFGGLRYSLESRENTERGFRVGIRREGQAPYGNDFLQPTLTVEMISNNLLRFTFDDAQANPPRYRVPIPLNLQQGPVTDPQYIFRFTDQNRLTFQVIRKSTGLAILDTGVGGLVLSDQFLQFSTKLPSANVYGLGEQVHDRFRHQLGKSWAAFARDNPPVDPVLNLYGVQPFYTCVEDNEGNTHGVFLFNSNAQEYVLGDLPMITWRTIGGVLDFYIFLGPTPENVIQQYTEVVGRPVMPTYWSLGFQLSRYGYNNLSNMKAAVQSTLDYNIPLDVQYADIDHMEERRDFTVDDVNFAGLNDYWQSLRDGGMHVIIILDPALISNVSHYEPFEKLNNISGFISWPGDLSIADDSKTSTGAMLGFVWPAGKVAFPDFFKNQTGQVWKELIIKHHSRLQFDGLWIDMNEPANFGTNLDRPFNWPESDRPYWSLKCPSSNWDDPPYRPLAVYARDSQSQRARLSDMTLCMVGLQGEDNQYRHYDVHNLYGYSEAIATLEATRAATGERSIVISRSTFPGIGQYAGHWLGDNYASWTDLRRSVIGLMEFNLFGIPYVGADICGFNGEPSPELCLRWMQLGAFYPFSRNHNTLGQRPQHPGAFGPDLAAASRDILQVRYWLLPYLYTLFHTAHTLGNTVVRPLHHEFPRDIQALEVDQQFMWGPALLISPILQQGQTELQYYLPTGRWYDFYSGMAKEGPSMESSVVTLYSKPGLHMRAGHILPLQRPANNTFFSRQNPLTVRVMLDSSDQASGTLFWDDGKSVDNFSLGNYFLAEFVCSKDQLNMTVNHLHSGAEINRLYLETIIVYGIEPVSAVNIGNKQNADITFTHTYLSANKILQLTELKLPLQQDFYVTWHH